MSSTSSTSSSRSEGADPLRILWDVSERENFRAEVAEVDGDLVYHFWPKPGEVEFHPAFPGEVEKAYMHAFRNQPKDADGFPKVDIRAKYISHSEQTIVYNHGGGVAIPSWMKDDQIVVPLATVHVKVVGWASNPFADPLLRSNLFDHIDQLMRGYHALQEDRDERPVDPVLRRPAPCRRKQRRRKRR